MRAGVALLLASALTGCVHIKARHPLPVQAEPMAYGEARRAVIDLLKKGALQPVQMPFVQLAAGFTFDLQADRLILNYTRYRGLIDDKGVPEQADCKFEQMDEPVVLEYGNKYHPWTWSSSLGCANLALYLGTEEASTLFARALDALRRHAVRRADVEPAALSRDELAAVVQAAVSGKPAAAPPPRSDVAAPSYRQPERPGDFAVVVGIEDYSDVPEAQFAERDAAAVRDHLVALGFPPRNVVHLAGEKAGYKAIEKFVETWLPRNVEAGGRVFFFFSGHGAPDVKTGRAYLLPWDGDPAFLENTGYPLERLYAKLGALKASEVVVALDACFSGAGGRSVLAAGTRPLVVQVDVGRVAEPKLVLLAAAAGDQVTSTLPEKGHGLFTYFLLKGLNGEAKGSRGITASSLFDYLKPRVQDEARRQNREQTPRLDAAFDPLLR